MAADRCSSPKVRLGVGSGRQFLRLHQCLASLVEVGDGGQIATSFRRRAGVPAPAMSLELPSIISKFVRIFSVKLKIYCAKF
jgi:hypothetical protein